MNEVVIKLKQSRPDDPEYMFACPGCGYSHWFKTTGKQPVWTFNGDMVRPTISPSILTMKGTDKTCHSFVKDGQIQFLGDCWHELKNRTVPLEPYDE